MDDRRVRLQFQGMVGTAEGELPVARWGIVHVEEVELAAGTSLLDAANRIWAREFPDITYGMGGGPPFWLSEHQRLEVGDEVGEHMPPPAWYVDGQGALHYGIALGDPEPWSEPSLRASIEAGYRTEMPRVLDVLPRGASGDTGAVVAAAIDLALWVNDHLPGVLAWFQARLPEWIVGGLVQDFISRTIGGLLHSREQQTDPLAELREAAARWAANGIDRPRILREAVDERLVWEPRDLATLLVVHERLAERLLAAVGYEKRRGVWRIGKSARARRRRDSWMRDEED